MPAARPILRHPIGGASATSSAWTPDPPAEAPDAGPCRLEPSHLDDVRAIAGAAAASLAEEFGRDIDAMALDAEDAVLAGDHHAVVEAAHRLRGSAQFVGAASLARLAGAIERAAAQGGLPDGVGLESLRVAARAVVEALRAGR